MMSWVRSLVWVIQQLTWRGCMARAPRKENTGSGRSPGCSCSFEKSMVRPSMRGGVPVFEPAHGKLQLAQARGERQRRRIARPARPVVVRGRRGRSPPRKVPAVRHHRPRLEARGRWP